MGILLNFFKEVNDEANRNISKENADRICLEVIECLKNGEYPPEELFVRGKKAKAPYSLFEKDAVNIIAYYMLKLAEYRGLNARYNNNTDSMDTLFTEIIKIHDGILEFGLDALDLENSKEYLSNKEFLEKYNFTDDIYEYIDTIKKSLKEEMYHMAAICSYIDTIIYFSELLEEYYNNFREENKLQVPINFIPSDDTFEKSITREIKDGFFRYKFKNVSYYDNDMDLIAQGKLTYHPNSEIENPYTLYKIGESGNVHFPFYSYKELEKEFELFYINVDIDAYKEYSQALKINFNKKISAHWFAIESLKEKVSQFKALKQGEDGENYAYSYLKEHLPENWVVLQNINTPYKDSQRENDIIVINEKGVFTIEVKNYIGGSLEIKNDGKVIHQRGGDIVDDKQDIIEQSENHVTAVADFLEKNYPLEGVNWIDFVKGIVVISNDEMTINNESSYPIFRTSLVRPYILNLPNNVLNKEQIKDIKDLMEKTSKDDLKFSYMAFLEGFYNENFMNAIKDRSNKFFNNYVKLLDEIDRPMNISQSLACFPKRGYYGGYEIISNEKDDHNLHRKLKNIFDEENADHVAELWFNNFRIK